MPGTSNKSAEKFMINGVIGPSGESTAIVLLMGSLPLNNHTHTYILAVINLGPRNSVYY